MITDMKTFKYLAAAALTFLAVGCNKEQVTEVPDGQMVDVTFTAALPGEMATKAIGDGQTAKNLYVSVYENDAEKTKLDLDKKATFTDLKTQVKFSLVKGKTYNFVFWAQAEGATCYNIDDLKNIKISYEGAVANDEKRDAFYATRKELKVNGALTETIKLYRPFAQVNFGTADLLEAAAAGFVPKQSVFTATDVANVFDTFNAEGKVEGTATDKVTFAAAKIPVEPLVIKDGTKYAWMTMNYIIPVGKQGEKHISNVTAEFIPETGDAITASSPQTPVQNNYRTNILGNLLTSQVIFNVEIVPIFNEPDNDIDIVNVKDEASLRALRRLVEAVPDTEVVFPVHRNPLVREAVSEELEGVAGIHLVEPMEYEPFTNLMARSAIVLTDSGGIQEEAPSLGKPVLVLRDTTERPEAVEAGTVKLVGTDEEKIFHAAYELLTDEKAYKAMAEAVNPYGDGHSAERIADALLYIEGLSDKKPTKFIAK